MKRVIAGTVLAVSGLLTLCNAAPAQDNGAAGKTITITFKDASLRDAVETLFKGTGINYSIAPEAIASASPVNLNLEGVPLETALRVLLNQANLTYSKKDGIYEIKTKIVTPDTTGGAMTGGTPTDTAPLEVTPPTQIEKIPLNYADSYDIYGILTGQGSNRAASNMGGGGMSGGFGSSGFGGGGFGSSGFGGGGFGSSGFGGGGFGSSGFGGMSGGFGSSGFGSSGFGGGGFGSSGFGGGGFGGGFR